VKLLIAERNCFEHWAARYQTWCSLNGQAKKRNAKTWRDAKKASSTSGNPSWQIVLEWNVKNFILVIVKFQGRFVWHHGAANVLRWARAGQLFNGDTCLTNPLRV
jgi:hypothetical protein